MKIAERFKVTYLLSNHYTPAGGQPKKINHYLSQQLTKNLCFIYRLSQDMVLTNKLNPLEYW